MASITNLVDRCSKKPNGSRRLDYVDRDGKPKAIYLGKMPQRDADGIAAKVQAIINHQTSGEPLLAEVATWIAKLGAKLAAKLAAKGIIAPRTAPDATALGPFLDAYVASRTDAKPNTLIVLGHTRRCLVQFFGADKRLSAISPGDADERRDEVHANFPDRKERADLVHRLQDVILLGVSGEKIEETTNH